MYCKNCGRKLDADSHFCVSCGTKVDINTNDEQVNESVNLSDNSLKKKKKKKPILLIIVLVFGLLFFLGKIVIRQIPKYFYGNDYTIVYAGNWSSISTTTGYELLKNDKYGLYFMPAGNVPLLEVTSSLSCNFENSDCQKRVYDRFYADYNDSLKSRDMSVFSGSTNFNVLKEDIYYAYFDYGKSSDDRAGRFFLIVSEDEELLLSFTFEFNSKDVAGNNEVMLELLRSIDIDD